MEKAFENKSQSNKPEEQPRKTRTLTPEQEQLWVDSLKQLFAWLEEEKAREAAQKPVKHHHI